MRIKFKYVFDRKKEAKTKTDKGTIELRYYENPKAKYYNTNIKVLAIHWDEKNKRIVKLPNADSLNTELDNILARVSNEQSKAFLNKEEFGLENVKRLLEKQKIKTDFFNVFALNETNENNKTKLVTKRSKRNTLNKLLKYHNSKNILFSEIDYTFCNGFINYLTGLKLKDSTIQKNYKNCKSMVESAIKHGNYTKRNPFKDIIVKVIEKPVQALETHQLEAIENLVFENNGTRLETIRDMFLFSCYTGLRISDLIKLNKSQLKETDKGIVLTFTAQKTGKHGTIPIYALFPIKDENTTKPLKIINKYLAEDKELIFKKYSDQLYNRELKTIQHLANIDFNLTAHFGRKTFGTTIPRKGISAFALKEMMQHSNIKTTERYVKTSQAMLESEVSNGNW